MNYLENILNSLEETLVALGISLASVILFANVVLRYFFNSGWEWAEEAARYSIVWIVFLGGSICARKGMHLSVDAVAVRLSAARQRLLRILVDSLTFVFCIFLVIYGSDLVMLAYETEQLTPGLEMPIYYVYLAIPTGGALMALRSLQDLYRALRHTKAQRTLEAG